MGTHSRLLADLRKRTITQRGLLEYGHYGYMWATTKTNVLVASHTVFDLLEMEPFSEFLTMEKWRKMVHPHDLYKLLQAEEALLSSKNPVVAEYRMITKKHKYIYVSHFMQLSASFEHTQKILSTIDDITEQKRADILLEVMNEGFFELDRYFTFRRINDKAQYFFGVEREFIMDKPFIEIFPEIEHSAFYTLIKQAAADKKNHEQDIFWPVTNRWLHISISPYTDGIIVICYDIQNEKDTERKLRESESYYHSLIENNPDVITRWNEDLKLVFANSAFEAGMGIAKGELYGKNSLEMGQPDEIAKPFMKSLRKVFKTGEEAEHFNSFPTPGGKVHFYSRIIPEKNDKGQVETVLSVARNITDLRNAEQELSLLKNDVAQRATDKYLSLFNSIDEGFCIIEVLFDKKEKAYDYCFLEANSSFEKQTGLKNVVGKTMKAMVPYHEQHWFDIYGRIAKTGEPERFESEAKELDRYFDAYAFRVDEPGKHHVAVLFKDITERKSTEERQRFALQFSDATRTLTDPLQIKDIATQLLGEHLDADLVHYAEANGDQVAIDRAWSNGIPPIIGNVYPEAFGKKLVAGLREGKTCVCFDANTDMTISEAERQQLKTANIIAYIAVPLIKNGTWVSTLAVHTNDPRKWKPLDIELVEDIAERTWAAVEKASAEKALRESEQRLQRMVNVPGVGVLTFDSNVTMINANDAFLEMVGYSREEFESKRFTWKDFTPPEHVEASLKAIEQLQNTGLGGPYEKEYFRKDGSRVWMMFVSADLGDGTIGEFAIDISRRKQIEETLRKKEEQNLYLLHLSDALRPLNDPDEMKITATRILGEYLGADRALYAEYVVKNDIEYFLVENVYFQPGFPFPDGLYPVEAYGRDAYEVMNGTKVVVNDIESDAGISLSAKEAISALKIGAYVGMPLLKGGHFVALLSVHQSHPRTWQAEELALIEETADRTWAGVERAKAEKRLKEFNISLEKQIAERTADLKTSKEFLKATLDSSLDSIQVYNAVRNRSGEIVDFTWTLTNHVANQDSGNVIGKSLLEQNPGVIPSGVFRHLVEVTETGVPQQMEQFYDYEQFNGWFLQSMVKLDDGVVVTTTNITARKKTEQDLVQQAHFIESVAGATADILFVMDIDSKKILYTSRAVAKDLGYSAEQLQSMQVPYFDLMHPEDVPAMIAHVENMRNARDGEVREIEYRLKHADGSYHSYCDRNTVFRRDERGNVIQKLGIAQDITTRKQDEQQIKTQANYIKRITDTVPDMISVYELATRKFEFVNKTVFISQGFDPDAMTTYDERRNVIVYKDDLPLITEYFNQFNSLSDDEGVMTEYRAENNRGELSWYRVRGKVFRRDENGKVTHVLNVIQNINDQKNAEEAIKNANEEILKQNKIMHQSEELARTGSWEYDVNTKEFLWSDGMYKLFGIERNIRITPEIYVKYAIEQDKALAKRIRDQIQKDFYTAETTLRMQADGIVKTVRIKATPFRNEKGEVEKMLGVDMDVTAAVMAAEKIQMLNKTLLEKNRELESMNTELTTLNSIAANDYLETLRHLYTNLEFIVSHDARQLSDAGKANLRRAQSGIQKLKLLTDDIVSFSKLQSLDTHRMEINLDELMKAVLADMREKVGAARAKIKRSELPVINGYPLLMSLLFHHLLGNAIKFRTKDTGHEIQITYEKTDKLQSDDTTPGTCYHRISIIDNGIGFDQKEANKIFTMFYRLHDKTVFKGSGVGLAICRKIMDIHNGFITAEGNPDVGSRFDCFFPVSDGD